MLTLLEAVRPFVRVVTAPDQYPLEVDFVRDDHLHAAAGDEENEYVGRLIKTSTRMAERMTRRSLMPQTLEMVMPRFCGAIVLPRPPIVSVVSVSYVDQDGATQSLSGSPAEYEVSLPAGPDAGCGLLTPLYGAVWPAARPQLEAVVVRYEAGYATAADVPEDIVHGMLLVIGELYKQRSESVHAFNQNPALIRARDLWMGYRVYG